MSNIKYDAIVGQGIEIVNRIPIPEDSIPEDARVEMEAKKAAGYYTESAVLTEEELAKTQGRHLDDY